MTLDAGHELLLGLVVDGVAVGVEKDYHYVPAQTLEQVIPAIFLQLRNRKVNLSKSVASTASPDIVSSGRLGFSSLLVTVCTF